MIKIYLTKVARYQLLGYSGMERRQEGPESITFFSCISILSETQWRLSWRVITKKTEFNHYNSLFCLFLVSRAKVFPTPRPRAVLYLILLLTYSNIEMQHSWGNTLTLIWKYKFIQDYEVCVYPECCVFISDKWDVHQRSTDILLSSCPQRTFNKEWLFIRTPELKLLFCPPELYHLRSASMMHLKAIPSTTLFATLFARLITYISIYTFFRSNRDSPALYIWEICDNCSKSANVLISAPISKSELPTTTLKPLPVKSCLKLPILHFSQVS